MENLSYRFSRLIYNEALEMETWKYSGFEKALYMDRYHESKKRGENPIKGPRGCEGYAVYNSENILFGLFEYYFEEDGIYLGLAINPIYVGRGLSTKFITEGIEYLKANYVFEKKIKIEVHRRNIQGIKAYEKCGFKLTKRDGEILLYLI